MDKRKLNGKSEASRNCQKQRIKLRNYDPLLLKSMYDDGFTLKQIGEKYNTTAATVMKFFRDNGIERRSKSEIGKQRMRTPERREYMRKVSIENYLKRRKFATGPEKHFECWLIDNNIKYETQYRKIGNAHPYDFFLKDYNLIVEIDGHYWHSKKEQKIKDVKHTEDAIRKGYFVVRIDTLELKEKSYEELLGDYIYESVSCM